MIPATTTLMTARYAVTGMRPEVLHGFLRLLGAYWTCTVMPAETPVALTERLLALNELSHPRAPHVQVAWQGCSRLVQLVLDEGGMDMRLVIAGLPVERPDEEEEDRSNPWSRDPDNPWLGHDTIFDREDLT